MIFQIPIQRYGRRGVTFEYEGSNLTLSTLRWNKVASCWMFDLHWTGGHLYGLVLATGVDLIQQHSEVPLPNLFALNVGILGGNIINLNELELIVVEKDK